MALKYYNVKTGEVVIADTEPKITALWASSDRSPNITQGQDFGWRLAPEIVVEMRRISGDQMKLTEIASRYNMELEAIGEPEILRYISGQTKAGAEAVADSNDYQEDYDAEVKRLQTKAAKEAAKVEPETK